MKNKRLSYWEGAGFVAVARNKKTAAAEIGHGVLPSEIIRVRICPVCNEPAAKDKTFCPACEAEFMGR